MKLSQEELLTWLYTQANLPNVEMLVVDSPLIIQYAFNLKTGERRKKNPFRTRFELMGNPF